jgi:hypothetical protein
VYQYRYRYQRSTGTNYYNDHQPSPTVINLDIISKHLLSLVSLIPDIVPMSNRKSRTMEPLAFDG